MVRLSRFQRLALLATSTTVITGGVLSHGAAFAAPMTPHTAAVTAAAQWKKITDTPSGITVQLPGKPQVQKENSSAVNSRAYLVPTRYGAIGFAVYDCPDADAAKPWDLKGGLKGAVDGYNSGDPGAHLRSTDLHAGTTADGDHYLDAKLVGRDGKVGHIRFVDHGKQALMVMNVGTGGKRAAVDRDYRQVLDSIKVPDRGARDHGLRRPQGPAVAT
ncbi:hypothetical protein [Streptomyces sp. NPDC048191]|uniref:hypothetical protein n=1 Tax=Streptomyces sp. NPDC048191 TaxID=3155484 RepID=UPI0033C5D145